MSSGVRRNRHRSRIARPISERSPPGVFNFEEGRAFAAAVADLPYRDISRIIGRGGFGGGAALGRTPPASKIKIGRGGCAARKIGRGFLQAISARLPYKRLEIAPGRSLNRGRPRLYAIGGRRERRGKSGHCIARLLAIRFFATRPRTLTHWPLTSRRIVSPL